MDDSVDDGDGIYHIVFSTTTSADAAYSAITPAQVTVTNTDNDSAGIAVSAISGPTTETGGTAAFTVVLKAQPAADVTVHFHTDDPTEGVTDGTARTFAAANWNMPQTVTVTGVDDSVDDGDVHYQVVFDSTTSADGHYADLTPDPVSVTNTDNDHAGVTVTAASAHTSEAGGTATFTAVLNTEPTASVVLHFNTDDSTEGVPSATSLTFTPANWNMAQSVVVTGVDDAVADGDVTYHVVFSASTSTDASYAGITPASVLLVNDDNDAAAIHVTAAPGLTTSESGSTATFSIVLESQPTANVTVGFNTDDDTEGVPNVTSRTFSPGNWSAPQFVTVTGQRRRDRCHEPDVHAWGLERCADGYGHGAG